MPPFTRKAQVPSPEAPSTPSADSVEPSAQQRYEALVFERCELEATIARHREEREQLLHQSEIPSLGAVTALATQVAGTQLQVEWINRQLSDLAEAVAEERRAAWEAAWQAHRPGLFEAQDRLESAITEFHSALHAAHVAFNGAAAFGNCVSDEFVRPVPEEAYNRYALVQYLRVIEQRRGAAPPAPSMLVEIDIAAGITAIPRFKPRRVAVSEIEAIGVSAEPRRVRILHGPARVASLNFGVARVFAGEQHMVPAKAAHALVASGIAEYVEENVLAATA
jgi:hypothetical protein